MTLDTLLIISTLAVTGGIIILEMVQTFQLTRLGRVLRRQQRPFVTAATTDPPELPALPHTISCTRCGHSEELHKPFDAAQCFLDGCKCKGWKRK